MSCVTLSNQWRCAWIRRCFTTWRRAPNDLWRRPPIAEGIDLTTWTHDMITEATQPVDPAVIVAGHVPAMLMTIPLAVPRHREAPSDDLTLGELAPRNDYDERRRRAVYTTPTGRNLLGGSDHGRWYHRMGRAFEPAH